MRVLLAIAPPLETPVLRHDVGLSIWMLAAFLRAHDVEVITADLAGFSDREIEQLIVDTQPAVVGLRCLTHERFLVADVLDVVKRVDPSIKTVVGGPHVTILYDQYLSNYPSVDYVVVGEGFLPLLRLVECTSSDGDPLAIEGIALRARGRVVYTGKPGAMVDLDSLSDHALTFDVAKQPQPVEMIYLNTCRGCPQRCAFCASNTIWGRSYASMSPDRIADKLERYVAEHGTNRVHFCDDTINSSKRRIIDLCRTLVERKIDIRWSAAARVYPLDEEIIGWLKRSGCVSLEFGVESGSEELRRRMRKRTTNDQIIRAFSLLEGAGIETLAFLLYGFPGESPKTIMQTYALLARIKPTYVHKSICRRLPGTEFETMYKQTGRFVDDDWLVEPQSVRERVEHFTALGYYEFRFLKKVVLRSLRPYEWLVGARKTTLHDKRAT